MRRRARPDGVSIVIPVWNQWRMTRACLDSLAPTVGGRDQVIVVDNGSGDETAAELARRPWLTVIHNDANRGFAAACNQGAAAARGSTIVFLNNDTLVAGRWLDGLLAPFADPAVFATGPRSNCVSGPQMVGSCDYDAGSPPSFQAFARRWRRAHRGRTTDTARLVGFCLAVRAEALRAIGGWDEGFATGGAEDDDLCVRLADAGGRLLICHDTFVHHHGHATFDGNRLDWRAIQQANVERLIRKHSGGLPVPRRSTAPLLSACLIVRDERAVLPSCLAALRGLADEVVVYDTGSSDGTQALARAAGATVVEGHWDDDFARARNAALDRCAGDWILQVDADEVFEGDPARLRAALASAATPAFAIEILNLGGDGRSDVTHRPCRLFRRQLFHWQGRLHERVVYRTGRTEFRAGIVDGGRLVHSGYTPDRMREKGKAERNVRLAMLEAAAAGGRHPVETLVNLGRSLTLAGRHDDALARFVEARALACESLPLRALLHRSAAQLCVDVGRPVAALPWLDDLERLPGWATVARYVRGAACVALERWRDALDAYDGLTEATGGDGTTFPMFVVHRDRARCHFALQQWKEAAAEAALVAVGATAGEPVWHILAESCRRTGRDLAAHLHAIADAQLPAVFAQLLALSPETAHAVLEGLVGDPRYRGHALALAIRIAPSMPLEHAVRWSVRLRDLGLGDHCPLLRRAADDRLSAEARLLSAATAQALFGDGRGADAVRGLRGA